MLGLIVGLGLGGLAVARALPLFGSEDPVSGPWHHESMTWEAAKFEGWDVGNGDEDHGTAAAALAWHTEYVDSYLYNPVWWASGGWKRFLASLFAKVHLEKLHFDDLNTTSQVVTMWDRYLGGSVAGLMWAAERGDVPAARHILGVSLHAQQDFYSHSNWVDDPSRRGQTWLSHPQTRDGQTAPPMDLYTGFYELQEGQGRKPHGKVFFACEAMKELVGATWMNRFCHAALPTSNSSLCASWKECQETTPGQFKTIAEQKLPVQIMSVGPGIALDSTWQADIAHRNRDLPDRDAVPAEALFLKARALAVGHSILWLRMVRTMMEQQGHAKFWTDVSQQRRGPVPGTTIMDKVAKLVGKYEPDLQQFEDRSRMLYTFMSAGEYGPVNHGEEQWFLRVELRTADVALAGTNGHIHADVAGTSTLLDHMHDRRPQGKIEELRPLEFDDFERGRSAVYELGPFAELPTRMTLRNVAPGPLDVLAGLWNDTLRLHKDVFDRLVELTKSLIAGNPEIIGRDSVTYDWPTLRTMASSGSTHQFELTFHEGQGTEGIYRLQCRLVLREHAEGLQADVCFDTLVCDKEGAWDRGSLNDEPFLLLSANPTGNPGARRSDIAGPYEGVSTGDPRGIGVTYTMVIRRHTGLLIAAPLWESDTELGAGRQNLLDRFNSATGVNTVNERKEFLDAIGAALFADWKLDSVDVYAYKRAATVQTARLVHNRRIDAWVEAGDTYVIPFDEAPVVRSVWTRSLPDKYAFMEVIPGVERPQDLDRIGEQGRDHQDGTPVIMRKGPQIPPITGGRPVGPFEPVGPT